MKKLSALPTSDRNITLPVVRCSHPSVFLMLKVAVGQIAGGVSPLSLLSRQEG